jgi:hypothetical protein
MARMVRLLRANPELMVLVKGMTVATRSVIFTLTLLTIIIYVFAIAFTQLAEGTELAVERFSSVPAAMSTLLLWGTLPDMADLVEQVGGVNPLYSVLMLIFILLASLTVLNMLIGVLCEVVSVVSAVEKEQMTVQFVKSKLLQLIETCGVDRDGNKFISRDEFATLLVMPEGARIIQDIGVDVVGLVDFADHIFSNGTELSFQEVFELVLQLRGTNTSTVRDIVDLRKFLVDLSRDSEESIVERICCCLNMSRKPQATNRPHAQTFQIMDETAAVPN